MWDAAEYGQAWAAVYDRAHPQLAADAEHCVAWLRDRRPRGGRLLELGVGTGRLAIPLAAAGFDVVGVDASERMLDVMAAKPGGDAVTGVLGDLTDPPVDGPFDVALLAFNTLFALPDQDAQIRCLTAAAGLLAEGGEVVVDAVVPQPWRLASGQLLAEADGLGHEALAIADHDPIAQVVRSARVVLDAEGGVRTLPVKLRYASVAEVDLMARVAGLALVQRTAGWDDAPLQRDATRHVSTYRRRSRWS